MKIPVRIQMTTGENGATALFMMLGYFGKYVNMKDMREACVTSRNGSSPEQLIDAAKLFGLEGEVRELPATVIMVAHRLSTVMGFDRIYMLEDGLIVEEGTYDELMEQNGKFAELVRKQLISEKEEEQKKEGRIILQTS